MALDYDLIMGLPPMEVTQVVTPRDVILYALGVGAGAEAPTDPDELQFVYEDGLKALPTMAVVLSVDGGWMFDPKYGLDWRKILHGEQSAVLHRTLPISGALRGVLKIDAIYDKGPVRGAVIYATRELYEESSGDHLATLRQSVVLRGDGGFGGSSEGGPLPHPTPDREPDIVVAMPTRPDQALLYRLSGDYNPLHIDPKIAAMAGFPGPILHGLASYGVVGRAVLKILCGNAPERLRRLDVRFSRPVFPGDVLRVEIWREGNGRAALRVRSGERNSIVLQNGLVEYEDGA